MPLYCYRGTECSHRFERVLPMADCGKKQKCPECGKSATRDLLAEHGDGTVDSQMREYTMWGDNGTRCYAMSYLPNQISDAQKKHKGRDFRLVNGCYLPVIKHRTDYKKYMKEYNPNYIEY